MPKTILLLTALLLAGCAGTAPATLGPAQPPGQTPQTAEEPTATPGAAGTPGASPTAFPIPSEASMTFTLSSSAFAQGQAIPDEFSCKGRNISPALAWTGAPANTAAYALILDDPDAPAGTFTHWVIYNIPGISTSLQQAVPHNPTFDDGAAQGNNSGRRQYYEGPCPPSGTHRYFFRLYALDTRLDLPPGATVDQVTKAMQGHILAQAELMGTFKK